MADKYALLKRYWGFGAFRPLQEEVIDAVCAGSDTLALFPTGGGKSLCYQLSALMSEGLCLVVSPLIALMKDQVQALNERHLKAACIISGMSRQETVAVLNNCLAGSIKFLYVSPERLRQHRFVEHFRQMKVNLIAVDEAHCVSQWGHDFRPPYLQIADIRQYHPQVPLLALTATATPAVVEDIKSHLAMRRCRVFQASYVRPNLSYNVLYDDNKTSSLLRIAQTINGCGIVYTRNRRATLQVAETLVSEGVSAVYYHAGLSAADRDRRQAEWMQGKCRVMVATNAFGMGIDKADVRFVVHMDMPDSLEAYFQEAGRAGRDGRPAYAVALCSAADRERLRHDFASSYPSVAFIRSVYNAICNYYRVPLGSGADCQYDFEIEAVCEAYGKPVREFYSACRFLEREGLICIPDREESVSTLFIPVSRDELYRFQVNHLRYGDLLQALLRMYPGLLMSAVPIEERKVAARSMFSAEEVGNALRELQAMHIVEYRPRTSKPQIVFSSPRVKEDSIYLSAENYSDLKSAAAKRLQAVMDYIANTKDCRSRQLVAYFGETGHVADCGVCDVCRHRRPPADIEEAVLHEVERNAVSPQDLCRIMENEGYAHVGETLRGLLDRGQLYLDKNLLLRLS